MTATELTITGFAVMAVGEAARELEVPRWLRVVAFFAALGLFLAAYWRLP